MWRVDDVMIFNLEDVRPARERETMEKSRERGMRTSRECGGTQSWWDGDYNE